MLAVISGSVCNSRSVDTPIRWATATAFTCVSLSLRPITPYHADPGSPDTIRRRQFLTRLTPITAQLAASSAFGLKQTRSSRNPSKL